MNQTFETSLKNLNLIKRNKSTKATVSELTSESSVYSLDSPVQKTAASLMNQTVCSHLGPVLSDGRGCTSELRPKLHSESLRVHSPKVCNDTNIPTYVIMKEDTLYLLHLMMKQFDVHYFD